MTKATLEALKLEPIEIALGDQRFFLLRGTALDLTLFKPPKDPRYYLLGGIDSLLILRTENLKSQASAGTLADLSTHVIVDRGRLVGLWEYDLPTESIAWVSFGKKDKAIQEAVTRTENFVREQLGDAQRSFGLDSPTSRAPRIAHQLRKAAASA